MPRFKPTNVENLYLSSGLAPPYIRITVASQHEKLKQESDLRNPLFNHVISNKRMKSRHSFLHCVNVLDTQRRSQLLLSMRQEHLTEKPNKKAITPQE